MVGRHDAGLVHGAFGRLNERDLASEVEAKRILLGDYDEAGEPAWLLAHRRLGKALPIRDFTGEIRLRLPAGSCFVSRLAWKPGQEEPLLQALEDLAPDAIQIWQEHPSERAIVTMRGLQLGAVKIAASSEIRGVYVAPEAAPPAYPRNQALGLALLPLPLPAASLDALTAQVERLGRGFAAHYSTYNARGSWSALSLRGFYDEPERIEKPAEMSKRWKAEHAEELENPVRDTALRRLLPAVEPILAALPCDGLERVRLMALKPGGGELTRHADITDLAAGAEPGSIVRLHIPLVTNEACRFTSWDLDGRLRAGPMWRGGIFYLDTRKPHTAYNGGEVPRIHLVADVVANEETIVALVLGQEFSPAS